MLEVMYELPAKTDVKKCVVTKNVITKGERPVLVMSDAPAAKGSDKVESA